MHPFDQLVFKDFDWNVDLYHPLMAAEVALVVDADDEQPPASWQRAVYDEFMQHSERLTSDVFQAIFDYYQHVAPEYRQQYQDGDWQQALPKISQVEEIKPLLTPTGIVVPELFPDKCEIGLLFECSWEIEHGLAVKIQHNQVVEVGFQDICI